MWLAAAGGHSTLAGLSEYVHFGATVTASARAWFTLPPAPATITYPPLTAFSVSVLWPDPGTANFPARLEADRQPSWQRAC